MMGERFDRFEDVRLIDHRGALTLYSACHRFRRIPVLLKVVEKPRDRSDAEMACDAQKSLLLETIATDAVIHSNVVRVIDSGVGANFETFLALERLEGQSLAEYLARRGAMGVLDALRMSVDIARALVAAHGQRIVHSEVRPANIFLLANGRGAKLAGFGAAWVPGLETLRVSDRPSGTDPYLCARSAATGVPDERWDLYALGAILYEAIAGVRPAIDDGRFEIADDSLELRRAPPKRPSWLHELVPSVPRHVSVEVHRAIARDPEARPHSARELLHLLEQQLAQCGSGAAPRTAAKDDPPTVPYGLEATVRAIDRAAACSFATSAPLDSMREQPTVPDVPAVRGAAPWRRVSKPGLIAARDIQPFDQSAPRGVEKRRP